MNYGKYIVLTLLSLCFWLSACGGGGNSGGGIGEIFGLNRRPPDEFLVIARPPLTLPPDFTLSPTAREADPTAQEGARQVVFGIEGENAETQGALPNLGEDVSESEYYLLQQSEAFAADDAVRQQVDLETAQLIEEDASFIRDLLGTEKEFGTLLDSREEYERLQEQGETQ